MGRGAEGGGGGVCAAAPPPPVSKRLVGYFLCLAKTDLRSNDIRIQAFCFGKAICRLNVYRANPRDGIISINKTMK